jgi:uncharacterized membrane protein YecN with MAPEG domain
LLRRIRAKGNFIEYVPIGLVLLALAEMGGTGATLLWTMAVLLLLGRVSHAFGTFGGTLPPKAGGMLFTFAALLLGAGIQIASFFG